jgi:chorismate-pyruvate lyase
VITLGLGAARGGAARLRARRACAATVIAFAVGVGVRAGAQDPPSWPDTFESRLEALALIETLNADLLSSRSATATLERWCGDHRLAEDPRIVAIVIKDAVRPATAEQRERLHVSGREPVAYRHVRLRCGARTLSDAENWYVPSRLKPQMNRALETSDTPFGRVVQALEPFRQTFAAVRLWSPLPKGWERDQSPLRSGRGDGALVDGTGAPAHESGPLAMPDALLEHRALLYTRDHTPFAEVDEVYQRGILAFPPRR